VSSVLLAPLALCAVLSGLFAAPPASAGLLPGAASGPDPVGHRFLLHAGPTLSLPWAEHGQLSRYSGSAYRDNAYRGEAYVVPRRPGQNQVRYFQFDWRDFDYLNEDGSAGVRFYFYEREYAVARIAAGLVRQSWNYLVDRFQYRPSFKVPYILYNSYREFLQTNVFQVQEGTLGVTSPVDLRMTLPYFGEKAYFRMVSTHEMTHQFHIQKVADRAASAGLESPIGAFPLWFIEGLAEYYAHGQGIDPETDMFLRDIVLNPSGEIGYDIPSLEEDRPYSYLYTYKYGQAKLAFLAETYGEKVIQGVLDQSPRLSGSQRRGEARENFMQLLGRIANEQPQQMNARWQTWLRHRVLPAYLSAKQDLPDVTELKLPDELDWMVTTTDGNLILYRGVERETARAKLVLIDRRDSGSKRELAIDQHPGTESLHPVLRSVMAVHDTGVAWFAQDGKSDVLHYRPLRRVESRERGDAPFPGAGRPRIDLLLGDERVIEVVRDGLIEAGDPSFRPDGKQLAFYGLDNDGKEDIYVLDLAKPDPHVVRLTEDLYSERDLSWGEDGIVYASDATESGKYNLFRIDPVNATRVRLTDAPLEHRSPVALPGGAVVFSSTAGGKTDIWFLQNGKTRRITDFATALGHPALSPSGIYAVGFYGARYRMFEVATPDLLALDEQDAIPPIYAESQAHPQGFPDEPIPLQAPHYNPYDVGKNWRIEGGGAVIGGVGVGLAPVGQGAVVFSDVLNDRSFLANLAIYGSFDLTDALAFYIDRSERLSWGVGLFNTFQQGRDVRFPSVDKCGQPVAGPQGNACQVFYLQKQYGVIGLLSYPFSTFSRFEGTARVQGVNRSLLENGILDANYVPTTLPESELARIRGFSPNLELTGTWGWDTTRFGPAGTIGGTSLLVELGSGVLPGQGADALYAFAQTDAIQTLRVIGRSKLWLRAALGLAQGSRFGRTFYLSSFDNLRGFRFNDARLLGDGYYVSQAEFAFPLDVLVRIAFFSNITGIVGVDFGGVFQTSTAYRNYPRFGHLRAAATEAWANRTMDYVLGANFGLGPFELRVQFAHGIDVGGIVPERDSNGDPTWVPNISLRYAYF
jgi:hypothetical protein